MTLPLNEYIYIIHPFRDGFFSDPTPAEEAVMTAHFNYLEAGTKAGTVVLAGPCLDDTIGLVIFRAADDAAANAFMMNDPSIQANVMLAELHPMRISLLGAA